ncbi:MAG: hypothetical protein ACRDL4_07085, partial [Thermoleophilaceae bacterium]
LLGVAAVAVVGLLLVIGLIGDDGEQAAQETTPRETRPERPERPEPPPPPRRVVLRVAPEAETYVCLDTGPGTDIRFEDIIDAPRTFRGRRLRVNLGNTSVEVTANGEPVDVGDGPDPVGFAFAPGSTRPLPLGERPCA